MYNTDFICTYKLMDSEEDCKLMYQIQLLQAFGIDQMNEEIVNLELCNLFEKIKNCITLCLIMEKYSKTEYIANIIESLKPREEDGKAFIFTVLFQYDYFDLIHKSLCEFLNTGIISDKTADEFIRCINLQ